MVPWLCLIAELLFEVGWPPTLKSTAGYTKPLPTLCFVTDYAVWAA
jgi:multidrug transporter EmrE-like cation transporter